MNAELTDSIIATQLPAAARGDQAAYGRIVASCQGMVASIALAIVRDVPASEDIAQDAFLSAWQNLYKLGNPHSFLPWLRQITRNISRDHLRAQRHRANPQADIEALIASVADASPGPAETLAEDQEARIAAAVIDALPEDTREVLLLYYREGQSSSQVASLLGLQDVAVRKRLSRARKQVRAEFLERLGEFARDTGPSSVFTSVVLSAAALASPPAAAATAVVGSGALAGKSMLKVLLGALGGFAVGLAAVWWGLWKQLRDPIDAIERRDLLRYGAAMSVLVLAFTIGIVLVDGQSDWVLPALTCAIFSIGALAMVRGWLPRILARRHAEKSAHANLVDAARASSRQAWLGVTSVRGRIDAGSSRALDSAGGGAFGYLRAPFDAREQRSLRRYALASIALLAAYALSLVPIIEQPGWMAPALLTGLYVVGMLAMARLWLPRILARRQAHEKRVDPATAADSYRKPRS